MFIKYRDTYFNKNLINIVEVEELSEEEINMFGEQMKLVFYMENGTKTSFYFLIEEHDQVKRDIELLLM